MSSSSAQGSGYDLSFKILLIGDSGVGKSSLLVSFISNSLEDIAPTIGIYLISHLLMLIHGILIAISHNQSELNNQEKFCDVSFKLVSNKKYLLISFI